MRQRISLKESQVELAVAAIPVVTTILAVYLFVSWPSAHEQYMTRACDGVREASAGIAEADRAKVSAGWDKMGGFDPAGDGLDAHSAEASAVQKGWAGSDAVRRSLKRWDKAPGPASVAAGDRHLIEHAVEACAAYDYSWYSPYPVIASP